MSRISRRKLITAGLATAAGATGLGVAAKLAGRYGLIPPDSGVLYGAGETLTYAAQRLLAGHSLAREFDRSQISKDPFANRTRPLGEDFTRLQETGFAEWRVVVDGMAARPASFSVAELRGFLSRTQITMLTCEEGWSYIAEWTGVPLSDLLDRVGALPQVRYVVYRTFQSFHWGSLDMADALHPQTLLALGMNGSGLSTSFGGPVRLRVPRQLGYKNGKFVNRLTLTDSLKGFGKGLGSGSTERGYAWYAGI
jgi:DMSO/TMAO reductase YedYZ molybdopterin-dependent catalytic subunit